MNHRNELNRAFQEIIEHHQGILFKVARAYCFHEEDRKDLIQEMLIQIWKSLPRYRREYAITTWLYRISLNVAISFYRKSLRRKKHEGLVERELLTAQSATEDKEAESVYLERIVMELNEFDRALLILYLDEKSYAEICEISGISVSNVGTRLGRIREKLKNKFSQFNR